MIEEKKHICKYCGKEQYYVLKQINFINNKYNKYNK